MTLLDKDFIQGNILDNIRDLRNQLETLQRTAVTAMTNIVIDGDIYYTGDLIGQRNNAAYTGYTFVPLLAPLTSTSWDGDAYSDTPKTKIDLSAVFSAPAGIRAVLVWVAVRDSDSAATDTYLILGPADTADIGINFSPYPVDDRWARTGSAVIPCDANGDIYYQINASGASTFDVYIQIWGYWL